MAGFVTSRASVDECSLINLISLSVEPGEKLQALGLIEPEHLATRAHIDGDLCAQTSCVQSVIAPPQLEQVMDGDSRWLLE